MRRYQGRCRSEERRVGKECRSRWSPSRLVLREFVGRTLLESLLVLPGLASAVLALFSSEGRTLHDRLSRTIVVQSKGWEEDD